MVVVGNGQILGIFFQVELLGLPDELDIRYERKQCKNDSKFLA